MLFASCAADSRISGKAGDSEQSKWVSITAGKGHSLAVKSDSTLWAWGGNGVGQLGDGTTDERHFPVQVGSDHDWRFAVARFAHTLAVKSDGTLWAWGGNGHGQLGDGTTSKRISPVQIGRDKWASISLGRFFSTGIELDRSLWAWGGNGSGW